MKKFVITAFSVCALAMPALADSKPTAEEITKLKAAAEALGYTGGEYEKEDEGSGIFEVDDAKAANGAQYDLKFDKDFQLLSATKD